MNELDHIPRLDRRRLEAERRADPLHYGLEPYEGYHLLWARVQAEPADAPWYRRIAAPLRLAASGAVSAALVVGLAVGLNSGVMSPFAEQMPAAGDAGAETLDYGTENDGRSLAPSAPAPSLVDDGAGEVADLPPAMPPSEPLGDPNASCMRPEDLGGLAARDFALDGTLTALDGDEATFEVHLAWRGAAAGDVVTLRAPNGGVDREALDAMPGLKVGERYLVSGDDNVLWSCGFSVTYSPEAARSWEMQLAR